MVIFLWLIVPPFNYVFWGTFIGLLFWDLFETIRESRREQKEGIVEGEYRIVENILIDKGHTNLSIEDTKKIVK